MMHPTMMAMITPAMIACAWGPEEPEGSSGSGAASMAFIEDPLAAGSAGIVYMSLPEIDVECGNSVTLLTGG